MQRDPRKSSDTVKEYIHSGSIKTQCPATDYLSEPSNGTQASQDLVLVGLGPASLSIAIAILECLPISVPQPKVTILERQSSFAWHSGMQLPGAKMQISFLKDLATPRNPRSHFTFINYLKSKDRLDTFTNLGTFLPSRLEYEDYLRWCASHFEQRGWVKYGQEVVSVSPSTPLSRNSKVTSFKITSRDIASGILTTRFSPHVVIAIGGRGKIPPSLPSQNPAVVHSSKYSISVPSLLPDTSAPYNIAVVGSGQSAAEIFNDLPSRFPNAKVTLIIKSTALKPSDDSPFVNEVFDPDRVDGVYAQSKEIRRRAIENDRATNYGVVRLELLEHLYEKLYLQRLKNAEPSSWKVKIVNNREVVSTEQPKKKLILRLRRVVEELDAKLVFEGRNGEPLDEEMEVDAVFVATGYLRNAHEEMLAETKMLVSREQGIRKSFPIRRDYRVDFDEKKVANEAGVWLQGCNESTHGLSDTLLSILAVRGGELVQSIFGNGKSAELQNDRTLRAKL